MINCPNCGKQLMPDSSNPMRMKCTYCDYVLDPTAGMDPLPGLFPDSGGQNSIPVGQANTDDRMASSAYASQNNTQQYGTFQGGAPQGVPLQEGAPQIGVQQSQSTLSTPPLNPNDQFYAPPQGAPVFMPQAPLPQKLSKGFAIAALVLGILSLLNCWIPFVNIFSIVLGILALVFGILSLVQIGKGRAAGKGMSVAGVICGGIGLVLSIIILIVTTIALMAIVDEYSYYYTDDDIREYLYELDDYLNHHSDGQSGHASAADGWTDGEGMGSLNDDAAWTNMSFALNGKNYTLLKVSVAEFQEQSGWKIDYEESGYPRGYIVPSGASVEDLYVTATNKNEAVTIFIDAYNPGKDQCDLEKCMVSSIWVCDYELSSLSFEVSGGVKLGDELKVAVESYGDPTYEEATTSVNSLNYKIMAYFTSDFMKSLALGSNGEDRISSMALSYLMD